MVSHFGENSQVIHPGVDLQNLSAFCEAIQASGSFPPCGPPPPFGSSPSPGTSPVFGSLSTAFEQHAHVVGLMVTRTMPVTKIIIVPSLGEELCSETEMECFGNALGLCFTSSDTSIIMMKQIRTQNLTGLKSALLSYDNLSAFNCLFSIMVQFSLMFYLQ